MRKQSILPALVMISTSAVASAPPSVSEWFPVRGYNFADNDTDGIKLGVFSTHFSDVASIDIPKFDALGATGIMLGYSAEDWSLAGGSESENDRFPGIWNSGAFPIGDIREFFAGVTRRIDLSPRWSAHLTGTVGITYGSTDFGITNRYICVPVHGLVMNLTGADVFGHNDLLQFSVGILPKVFGGTAISQTAMHDQNGGGFLNTNAILADGKPEFVVGASFTLAVGKIGSFGRSLQYKLHNGGFAGISNKAVVVGYKSRF
jgi:hypothetical protein